MRGRAGGMSFGMRPQIVSPGSDFVLGSERVEQDIAAYIAGDDEAGDRICRSLEPVIRAEVRRFLPAADLERDDIVQETLLALLAYLRRAGVGPQRPEAFVVTMAGNRCRNLYAWRKRRPTIELGEAADWLPGGDRDPLAMLEAKEVDDRIRSAFALLDAPCRRLLRSIYLEQRPMEELQREAGLGTVQGLYYRKYVCLRKLTGFLNQSWFSGRVSGAERRSPGGDGKIEAIAHV